MLERGIGVSGERLERGGVVGGLPCIGLAGKHLAEQHPRFFLAPGVRFCERAHVKPSPQWHQHGGSAHRRIALKLVERDDSIVANAHDY